MRIATLSETRWGPWILGLLVITVIALLSSTKLLMELALMGKTPSVSLALRRSFEDWYAMGVFIPAVLVAARKVPIDATPFGRWLGLHATASVLFSIAYMATFSALLHGQISIEKVPFEFFDCMQKLIVHYLPSVVGIYFMVVLGHNGWFFYQRSSKRELRTAELETQLVQARLEALRMQLNPHFLFNTLHAISSLVHQNPKAADRTIARLSDLLRHTLNPSHGHESTLRQEMALLSCYLDIEKTRFGDALSVDLQVDPSTLEALVPTLILQPLVENAIRHGFESLDGTGVITIRTAHLGSKLQIEVIDNGQGLSSPNESTRIEGVGLSNTRSRLQHLYGDQQALDLEPAQPRGTRVRLSLPFRSSSPTARKVSA